MESNKVWMIGDMHLALGFPNKYDKWHKVHKQYMDDFLFPLLRENVKEGDIIIQMGDLYDNRDVIPIDTLNYGINIVEELSKIAPVHIIAGNHDLWSKSTSEINSLRPLRFIPNVDIYDDTSVIEYNGQKLCLMPYIHKKKDQIDEINKYKDSDYLFCHSDLNGCRMHLTSVGHRNSDKINVEEFSGFKGVYSGHIHIRQINKNFEFIGSIFQMDRNDINDIKGITVLDTDTGLTEFYENDISPVFKKVNIISDSDIDNLEDMKLTEDYIDLTISNNLLVNNRKLRRKLESLLENGNFSSISYLDDIKSDESVDESMQVKLSDSLDDIDISIQLDYEEYIAKYIESKKYENEDFNTNLLGYYQEIIAIYQDNYKLNINDNN